MVESAGGLVVEAGAGDGLAAGAVPGIGKTTKPEEAYGILEALLNEKADEFYTASMAGVAPGSTVPDSATSAVEGKAAADGKWQ